MEIKLSIQELIKNSRWPEATVSSVTYPDESGEKKLDSRYVLLIINN